jgi:hypothetical protein
MPATKLIYEPEKIVSLSVMAWVHAQNPATLRDMKKRVAQS